MIKAASLASHLPRMSSITYRSRPISDIQLNSFPEDLQPASILKQQPKNDRLLLKSYMELNQHQRVGVSNPLCLPFRQ